MSKVHKFFITLGSIFFVLWGIGGLLSTSHYYLAGFISGLSFLCDAILLLKSPILLLSPNPFKESNTIALYKQYLFAIMEMF